MGPPDHRIPQNSLPRITERLSFKGKIVNSANQQCDVLVNIEYDRYNPEILNCRAISSPEDAIKFLDILSQRKLGPRIIGNIDKEKTICVMPTGFSSVNNEADIVVHTLEVGYWKDTPFASGQYHFCISIFDAPSVHIDAVKEFSYWGDIKTRRDKNDCISWETDMGNLRIANYYDYEKANIGIERAEVQIERSQFRIYRNFKEKLNIPGLFKKIESDIDDILIILSFINRRFIHWYEIEADFLPTERNVQTIKSLKRKKAQYLTGYKYDPLFHQTELKKGLLKELVDAYKLSSIKETIRRTIIFLLASYERRTIEAQVQAAYSSIEAIINALSEKHNIYSCFSENDTKQLLERLSNVVKIFFKEQNWVHGEVLGETISKLNEVKRRPIVSRIKNLIDIYKVDFTDIWNYKGEINLKANLSEIFARRNKLVHTGTKIDAGLLFGDLVRLRALSERFILAELGFKDYDRFFCQAYRDLQFL